MHVRIEATGQPQRAGFSLGLLHELVHFGSRFAGTSLLKCSEAGRPPAWRVKACWHVYGAMQPSLAFGSRKTEKMETSS